MKVGWGDTRNEARMSDAGTCILRDGGGLRAVKKQTRVKDGSRAGQERVEGRRQVRDKPRVGGGQDRNPNT